MTDYLETVEVILGEFGKYFALLLFSVLTIRLWRRLRWATIDNKRKNLLLACLSGVMACLIGYFSMCHSLSRLYYYYGSKAFDAGNWMSAASLFDTSSMYWEKPDAVGREGICLLFSGKPDTGKRLLETAKSLRGGVNSYFEIYYMGLYYFFLEQPDKAVPLLEIASDNTDYRWNAIKFLSVIDLEKKRPDDARLLMKHYLQGEVADRDEAQAYVMVSFDLLEGKKKEAASILVRFPSADLLPFWKPRFETLRAKTQN
jgi:hypothetical protein